MQLDNGNDKHLILNIFGGGLIRSSLEVIEGGLGSTPPPPPPGLVAGRKKDRTYVPTLLLLLLLMQNHVSEVAVDYDMATENMSTTLNSEISAGYSCKKELQIYFLGRNSSKVK